SPLLRGRNGAIGHRHLGGQRDQGQSEGGIAPTGQPVIGVERIGERAGKARALAERADEVAQSLPHVDFLFTLAHALTSGSASPGNRGAVPLGKTIASGGFMVHRAQRIAALPQSEKIRNGSTSRAMTRSRCRRLGPSSRKNPSGSNSRSTAPAPAWRCARNSVSGPDSQSSRSA